MELYVLDSLLRRTAVIDSFESVVWTERFNDVGDLTLNIHSTLGTRNLFTTGTLLAMNRSNRVMVVETVEDKVGTDGSQLLVVTGSSLEIVMDDRAAYQKMLSGAKGVGQWIFDQPPAQTARDIFKYIMIDGQLDVFDTLPFYADGNLYPADTIPEPADNVNITLDPATVLDDLKTICQTYDLGFRLCRNADNSQIFFNVYSGNDRTSGQTVNPPVIFAPALDNLLDSSYLQSQKQYKNVAYVVCPVTVGWAYAAGVDDTITGLARRVLLVNATDIDYPDRNIAGPNGTPVYTITSAQQNSIKVAQGLATTTQIQNDSLGLLSSMKRLYQGDINNIAAALDASGTGLSAQQKTDINNVVTMSNDYNATEDDIIADLLQARGEQELAKNNYVTAFDGEIPQVSDYKYDRDYFLGDILEVRNSDGIVNNVRVTEQIFSQDSAGEKSYPTLSSRLVITPGVWAAWDANKHWADEPDTEHWADLPD